MQITAWKHDKETDTDAVMDSKCYNCGGYGYLARQCPTVKGKGTGGFKGQAGVGKSLHLVWACFITCSVWDKTLVS